MNEIACYGFCGPPPRSPWTACAREARLQDARHTAATVLLILGVPDHTVMDLLGSSTVSMKTRHRPVAEEVWRDVAERLNGYVWNAN